jgi:hypothetical protein
MRDLGFSRSDVAVDHSASAAIYREITAARRDEAVAKGFNLRHFFPHRFYYLPKCGPDGMKLAQWMCGTTDPAACWEIALFADESVLEEFPPELFFDDDVVWHQQHFGRAGHIASADLVVGGECLYAMAHVSDIVQRIARRPAHRTRIEKRFRGWHHMLLNSIANFALESGAACLRSPVAEFARLHTDRQRVVQRDFFERTYDRDIRIRFPAARADDRWWTIDARTLEPLALLGTRQREPMPIERVVCIFHDTERGRGHVDVDPAFAALAERTAPAHLTTMLAIERAANVRATYDVVGVLLPEVRGQIEAGGHCLAFHSYDHTAAAEGAPPPPQLRACRTVDYRIKGYRVPGSRLTAELTDAQLCAHNFEWLASSAQSLAFTDPAMTRGVVRIPIHFDDFPLHTGRMAYPEWEQRALETIRSRQFTAFGLHDCYADRWLASYPSFLAQLRSIAALKTADEVAFDVIFRNSR